MNLRTSLFTTTAAIALCAASTANAADPYLSFFGGVSSFDDEIQFSATAYNPGFAGVKTVFSGVFGGGPLGFTTITVGATTSGAPITSVVPIEVHYTHLTAHLGSSLYGTSNFSWEEEFDNGYVLGAALGTSFGNGFRAELELAYRSADLDNGVNVRNQFDGRNRLYGYGTVTYFDVPIVGTVSSHTHASGTVPFTGTFPPTSMTTKGSATPFPFDINLPYYVDTVTPGSSHGEVNVWSVMANVWLDIDPFGINPEGVTTFIGGGVGVANLELEYNASFGTFLGGSTSYALDDNETAWAYQLGAGIGFDLGGGMSLSAQYRWFATDDVDLGSRDMRVESHNMMVGLTIPMGVLLP